ncbi:hypothetical protein [Shewanella salipaludis]|uniref:Uncharacterized protein n=1 Tax=Shewanella salipaludis TaxID=2723052 RepID=A0A972FS63_9GAMM|nr:hypothetical protein [Shewanella salipaludis]NMH64264.1 hypothetical protein [Shewanella salipaludis]
MLIPNKLSFLAQALLGISALLSLSVQAANEAEIAFSNELIECAAYYQISSEAIAAMNAPQMQAVGERLKTSAADAVALASQYRPAAVVTQAVADAKAKQIQTLAGSSSLASLMGQYKDRCKTVLGNPEKRLDYWSMATM